jgi:hypothetical protein
MTTAIELDFVRDEAELAELRRADLTTLRPQAIESSYLKMPVRFSVNGLTVLLLPDEDDRVWLVPADGTRAVQSHNREGGEALRRLPIVFFASALSAGISKAAATGSATITVPEGGVLKLRRAGEVSTLVDESGRQAVVSFDELAMAIGHFRRNVVRLLDEEVPALRASSVLATWFDLSAE